MLWLLYLCSFSSLRIPLSIKFTWGHLHITAHLNNGLTEVLLNICQILRRHTGSKHSPFNTSKCIGTHTTTQILVNRTATYIPSHKEWLSAHCFTANKLHLVISGKWHIWRYVRVGDVVNVPIMPQPLLRLAPCVPHLRLVVPNGTASLLHQLGVVAALASIGAVAVVPHLLWHRGHEGDGKAHPDVRMGGRRCAVKATFRL